LSHEALRHKKLTRIIVTHFHPDHIGLAGELCSENIELWTSRTTWAYSRLLWQDQEPSPTQSEQRFLIQAGLSQLELVAQRYRQYPEYSQVVTPIPSAFFPLRTTQVLRIVERQWQVRMGYGHAPELVMLWTDDLAIVSDQILPNIAPTLSVSFTEPHVDLVSEWLDSCSAIIGDGNNEILCLPGHHLPFRGAALRCQQLKENTMRLIARVLELVVKPRTARDCLEELYRRPMNVHECRTYALEVMGILNHLWHLGQVDKHTTSAGVIFWQRRG
jgi:glyoxylase-like metal-dependent hydrolase (beta-lactamase superfamily II)